MWIHFSLLFPYSQFWTLQEENESSLALLRHFSWDNRVVIVLLLPFLSPHPALFTFDVSESFVWLHLWPNFLILPFLTFHFPRSKGPCCINLTAFSEVREKSQQHKPCHGTERVCAAAFAFSHPPPSKSPRVPTLCSSVSTFSPLWLPGLALFFMMQSMVPLALGPCTWRVVLGKTHQFSETQFPYLFPSCQQRQQQMLCSVPERITVMYNRLQSCLVLENGTENVHLAREVAKN